MLLLFQVWRLYGETAVEIMTNFHKSYVAQLGLELSTPELKSDGAQMTELPCRPGYSRYPSL